MRRVALLCGCLATLIACQPAERPREVSPAGAPNVGTGRISSASLRLTPPLVLPVEAVDLVDRLETAPPDAPLFSVENRVERAKSLQHTRDVFIATFRAQHLGPPDRFYLGRYLKSVLEERIRSVVLRTMAERRGFTLPEGELEQRAHDILVEIARRSPTLLPDKDDLFERAHESLLVEALVDSRLTPTEAELADFYEARRAALELVEAVRIRETLAPLLAWPWDRPEDVDARRARARRLVEEALDRGAAPAGVHIREGWVSLRRVPPELQAALRPLAVGEATGLVQTSIGVHHVVVLAKAPRITPSLDDIRPRLVEAWRAQHRADLIRRLSDEGLASLDVRFRLTGS